MRDNTCSQPRPLCSRFPRSPIPDRPITLYQGRSRPAATPISRRAIWRRSRRVCSSSRSFVINKPGGSGGRWDPSRSRRRRPDGYTLLVARVGSNAVLPALKPALSHKWNDFTFIGLLDLNPVVCVVNADSPYRTLDDFSSARWRQPHKFNYSSSGIGTILHLGAQLMLQAFNLPSEPPAAHVPYKGNGEAALTGAVEGGRVQLPEFPVGGRPHPGQARARARRHDAGAPQGHSRRS